MRANNHNDDTYALCGCVTLSLSYYKFNLQRKYIHGGQWKTSDEASVYSQCTELIEAKRKTMIGHILHTSLNRFRWAVVCVRIVYLMGLSANIKYHSNCWCSKTFRSILRWLWDWLTSRHKGNKSQSKWVKQTNKQKNTIRHESDKSPPRPNRPGFYILIILWFIGFVILKSDLKSKTSEFYVIIYYLLLLTPVICFPHL